MTKAEKICEGVNEEMKSLVLTIANATIAMQEKIEQQIPKYEKISLVQKVTVGTGETMLRQNPFVQEFRATVRDYVQNVSNLQDIIEKNKVPAPTTSLDDFRKQFKVC